MWPRADPGGTLWPRVDPGGPTWLSGPGRTSVAENGSLRADSATGPGRGRPCGQCGHMEMQVGDHRGEKAEHGQAQ